VSTRWKPSARSEGTPVPPDAEGRRQSLRSAAMGSRRVARRAGSQQAATETTPSTATTARYVTGSTGLRPNSWVRRSGVRPNARTGDPHHGVPPAVGAYPPPHGLLPWPVSAGELLVDHRHGLRPAVVRRRQVATVDERDAQGPEVRRTHVRPPDLHGLVPLRHVAFGLDDRRVAAEAEGHPVRQRGGRDAGYRLHALEELSVQRGALGPRVAGREQIERSQQDAAPVEPRIVQPGEPAAADEQPGAREQQDREGDLRHHQRPRQPGPMGTAGRSQHPP
jgi:hypothetical protein